MPIKFIRNIFFPCRFDFSVTAYNDRNHHIATLGLRVILLFIVIVKWFVLLLLVLLSLMILLVEIFLRFASSYRFLEKTEKKTSTIKKTRCTQNRVVTLGDSLFNNNRMKEKNFFFSERKEKPILSPIHFVWIVFCFILLFC